MLFYRQRLSDLDPRSPISISIISNDITIPPIINGASYNVSNTTLVTRALGVPRSLAIKGFIMRVPSLFFFTLHEPYFDLTLIREAHTKISLRTSTSPITSLEPNKIKLIAFTLFSAWRVVSTLLIGNPPCHGDTRLLVIPFSCSRISDYNPCCILF